MAFTPLSAKNALVRIGTYVFTARKWTVNPKGDALDITNFEGGGFADWIGGIIEAEFTIEAQWDSASDPFAAAPNVTVTTILSTIKLYTNGLASAFWSFPSALVTDTPMTADVRQTEDISCTCKAKGTFVYP